VTYGRLRTKENFKLLALKVSVVAYKRWSLTRGSNCSHLTRKLSVFWKTGHSGEVVTYERWPPLEVPLYLIRWQSKVSDKWLWTQNNKNWSFPKAVRDRPGNCVWIMIQGLSIKVKFPGTGTQSHDQKSNWRNGPRQQIPTSCLHPSCGITLVLGLNPFL